jgi:hypothetical protein
MNHCSLQQNAFLSREESRGFVPIYSHPVDSVVCPKPRRANNVIRPFRLHFRYKVSSFIIFVHKTSYCCFCLTKSWFALFWGLTVFQELMMYVILKPGKIFWTYFVERFVFSFHSVSKMLHWSNFYCISLVFLCLNIFVEIGVPCIEIKAKLHSCFKWFTYLCDFQSNSPYMILVLLSISWFAHWINS